MDVSRFRSGASTHPALNPSEEAGPTILPPSSLIIVTFEVGMLMRSPTEGDLTTPPPQTPPASVALMPGNPSFILHLPFPRSSPFQVLSQICSSVALSPRGSPFAPAYLFSISPSPFSPGPPAPSLFYFSLPFLSFFLLLLLSIISLFPRPSFPSEHLSRQSMPFHSGGGTKRNSS